jgi:hypothetical protein
MACSKQFVGKRFQRNALILLDYYMQVEEYAGNAAGGSRQTGTRYAMRVALSESLGLFDTLERGIRIARHIIEQKDIAHRA